MKTAIKRARECVDELKNVITARIEQKRVGFRGGFVSSVLATCALRAEGVYSGGRALAATMRELGYVPHPALKGGRSFVNIKWPDNARPVLYVKHDSDVSRISRNVEKVYVNAQSGRDVDAVSVIEYMRECINDAREALVDLDVKQARFAAISEAMARLLDELRLEYEELK